MKRIVMEIDVLEADLSNRDFLNEMDLLKYNRSLLNYLMCEEAYSICELKDYINLFSNKLLDFQSHFFMCTTVAQRRTIVILCGIMLHEAYLNKTM